MPPAETHPASWDAKDLLLACEVVRQRRSGPGGQHRNKVETAVVITHRDSGVRAEASERRSQEENRRVALFRLRLRLALLFRCPVEPSRRPSDLWASRRQGTRIAVNESHEDFPAILAEALDYFQHHDQVSGAAAALGISSSQFAKLLARHPPALTAVNERRREKGQRPLRMA